MVALQLRLLLTEALWIQSFSAEDFTSLPGEIPAEFPGCTPLGPSPEDSHCLGPISLCQIIINFH